MGAPAPDRWILHVDLDQFIAAVEVLRRPELSGRPVVVGGRGDPTERGVVSTASYEAREFGVGSGMPLKVAARKLRDVQDAVFLPVDAEAYTAASDVVMATLRGIGSTWASGATRGVTGASGATGGVAVQVLGWDEAFLQVHTADPEAFARGVQAAVLEATALHCSVGIGDNTLRAKIATDFGKPRGTFRLTAANWFEVMGDRDTSALWGIGSKTAKKLAALDIHTVDDLAGTDDATLAAAFGPTTGPWLRRLGLGWGRTEVDPEPYVPRGHGRETTFQEDLTERADVEAEIRTLAARVTEDVRREGRPAVRVTLKVRYVPFDTHTTTRALPEPTFDAAAIADAAAALVDRFDRTRAVRLLGVRLDMTPPDSAVSSPGSPPASR
ncbi:DNA polymerase IV [Rhodococcus gannanensis]|uniref:DNA polymerase IV n=1 Tax=Rhodococcus gannanensis TaxID=1960308 RepID=A0ABW4PCE6_9NOCA